ncbi:carboxylesterase/lipase family protein [Phenylobacterium soli]|uniref:Carboxylesterase n=1 Tax=Phenylobacterium soli TaxID=2170551 RepID=A0A328ABI7_9CAUL|nr:carboxylesterase family protein [Phenylobacterium soli]RAK51817.1 carboxylesterase [Phenylobacterium soli]
MSAGWTIRLGLAAALALGAAAGVTTASAAAMNPVAGDPVATASGKVAGTRLASGVKAYLGIPYAKPPVGDLRWRPPEPARWDGVWNADRKGPECIQVLRPHNINHYFGEEASGEDCLYMNVWAPAEAKAGDGRPVIVFIYGGGGTIGSSGMANYDGENAAKRGAIFVNFNYRVGLLGYMAHPELSKEQGGHSGNYGYLDQNAALRWIHDNIARFGGDPNKVVITGQSFGAGSVAAQLTSPLSKGLFRGAMMSSACNLASAGMIGGLVPLAEGEKVGLEAQKRLGATSLAAMRDVPADKILALQAESQVGANVAGLRAPQVIDGYFWTMPKEEALASHAASDVPIIASSNGDDLDSAQSPLTKTHTVAEYRAAAEAMYGPAAAEFLKLYPVKTDADVQPMAHRAAVEGGLLASSRRCGDLMAKYNTQATYIDLFTHRHPYAPGVTFADQNTATVGAYHTADVPYWFDTLDNYNLIRPTRVYTAYDRQLTDRMFGALVALAETGSPSTAALKWPAYAPRDPQYVVFGDSITVEKLPVKRMDWQAAHPVSPAARPALRSGPRD